MSASFRIRSGFLRIVGFLIPLAQSVPVWTGLMTLPFAGYLITVFTNLPVNLPIALSEFLSPLLIPEKALILIGLSILVYSIVYLRISKKRGLSTSGPYRLVRHPQYLGMILSTLGLTSWSVWILKNTFGVGFLSPSQTLGVWFIELFAYLLISYVEEQDLTSKYGESFEKYKRKVSYLIPFLKTGRDKVDILISIIVLAILLFGLTFGLQ